MRIDGKALAAARREATAEAVQRRTEQGLPAPVLAVGKPLPARSMYATRKTPAERRESSPAPGGCRQTPPRQIFWT